MKDLEIMDKIADVILAYRPKKKPKKRRGRKERKWKRVVTSIV